MVSLACLEYVNQFRLRKDFPSQSSTKVCPAGLVLDPNAARDRRYRGHALLNLEVAK